MVEILSNTSAGASAPECRFGVVTALPTEFAAMRAMLDSVEPLFVDGDPNDYAVGTISGADKSGLHHVVITLLKKPGNNSAAAAASHLLRSFPSVHELLMVGIAGGIPNSRDPDKHVRLGDIVISNEYGVLQYDHVKRLRDKVHLRDTSMPPSAAMLGKVNLLKANRLVGQRPWEEHLSRTKDLEVFSRPGPATDRLFDPDAPSRELPHPKDLDRQPGQPKLHYGRIGSANVLLMDPKERDRLRDDFEIRAIEMEGSGLADGAWTAQQSYILIRGISDYCDSHKRDSWQGYAAAAAAAYARSLIESFPADFNSREILETYLAREIEYSETQHPLASFSSKKRLGQLFQARLFRKRHAPGSAPRSDHDVFREISHLGSTTNRLLWMVGDPGAGKTWVLQHWRSAFAKAFLESQPFGKIPIYISLASLSARLSDDRTLPDRLEDTLDQVPTYSKDAFQLELRRCLLAGSCIVLLDGHDEIDARIESDVGQWVTRQVSSYPDVGFVIATRSSPHWWQKEMDFSYRLLLFDDETRRSFVAAWFDGEPAEIARRVLTDLTANAALRTAASNPLLLTMLCMLTGQLDRSFPATNINVSAFFDRCVRLMLHRWDISAHKGLDRTKPYRDANRRASVEEKIAFLAQLADHAFPRITVPMADALRLCKKVLDERSSASDIVRDVELNSGLLKKTGDVCVEADQKLEYPNLAFVEYFAAYHDAHYRNSKEICEERAAQLWHPQWETRLRLYFEMKPALLVPCVVSAVRVLPRDLGTATVDASLIADSLVILIDASIANWSGQLSIARLLRPLVAVGATPMVAVSGSEGVIDTSLFASFPNADIKEQVATYFVRQQKVTGPEFLSITGDVSFVIWGTEDRKVHAHQLDLFLAGKRWSRSYRGLFRKRAEIAVARITEQFQVRQLKIIPVVAEPLLIRQLRRELRRVGIGYCTVDPSRREPDDWSVYEGVMRGEKTPFEKLASDEVAREVGDRRGAARALAGQRMTKSKEKTLEPQLSRDAELAITVALAEAQRLHHGSLTIEHLLYALMIDYRITRILRSYGSNVDRLKRQLEHYLCKSLKSDFGNVSQEVSMASIKDVLTGVGIEVSSQGRTQISCTDFLRQIFSERESVAYSLLTSKAIADAVSAKRLLEMGDQARRSSLESHSREPEASGSSGDKALHRKVVFHNDDVTTTECVTEILLECFGMSPAEATYRMLQVHHEGSSTVGYDPQFDANARVARAIKRARDVGMPLKITIG